MQLLTPFYTTHQVLCLDVDSVPGRGSVLVRPLWNPLCSENARVKLFQFFVQLAVLEFVSSEPCLLVEQNAFSSAGSPLTGQNDQLTRFDAASAASVNCLTSSWILLWCA